MMPTTLVILLIGLATLALADKTKSNDQILKTEIEEALLECGDTVNEREFLNRSGKMKRSVTNKRYRRNVMEQMEDNTRERSVEESASGEWDYGTSGGKKNMWEGSKDNNSRVDNVYHHERRNTSNGTNNDGGKWTNSDGMGFGSWGGNNTNVQTQNSTRNNHNDLNNFDSRGARLLALVNKKDFIEFLKGVQSKREKRSNGNGLLNVAAQREVDERGIPKEGLFMKLIDDAVTSQQMKAMVEKEIKACFYQLTTESQDDGCSYSNALEHCLGLEIRKRKENYFAENPHNNTENNTGN